MRKLTRAQARMLRAILDHITREQISPTIRELGSSLGLSSSSTVWFHLAEIAKRGYISTERSKPRSIRVLHDLDGCPMQASLSLTRQEVSLV